MARRQSGGGYRPLVLGYLEEFAGRWNAAANGKGYPAVMRRSGIAEAIESGEPVTVSADLLFRALLRVDHPEADQFARPAQTFVLDPDGTIHRCRTRH